MPDSNNLGQYLRERRKVAGLTLEQVADAAGVSLAYVSKLERGERKGSRDDGKDTLVAIAQAIGANVESVLIRAGHLPSPKARSSAEAQAAVERAILNDHTLTPQDRQYLLKTIAYVRRAPTRR